MLVVLLRGVNHRGWSQLWCSGWNTTILSVKVSFGVSCKERIKKKCCLPVLKWYVFAGQITSHTQIGLCRGWIQIIRQAFPTLIWWSPCLPIGMFSCKESNTPNKRKMNVFYTLAKPMATYYCGYRQSTLGKTWQDKWAEKNIFSIFTPVCSCLSFNSYISL